MHLLTDRYLRGTLPEEEKAAFEERIVWDRDLLDELDIAERLAEGLRKAVKEEKFVVEETRFSVFDRLSAFFAVPQYAAAASFLLAVVLMSGIFFTPTGGPDVSPGDSTAGTEIIPLFATRGNDVPTITVAPDRWTVLLVDVLADYDSYRVEVRQDASGAESFWARGGLVTTYPESLAVGMPGRLLPPGRYVLSIEGETATDAAEVAYTHIQNITFSTVPAGE